MEKKTLDASSTHTHHSSIEKGVLPHAQPTSYVAEELDDDHNDPVGRAAERRLLLKIDLAVLPILALLFLVSFVDRSNIGNARIEGFEKSLHMNPKGNGYNITLFAFTIPYVLFEVPANMVLKKIKPQIWLSGLMFCWGVSTMGQGLTKSFGGLVACRALMGFFESGFVPVPRVPFGKNGWSRRIRGLAMVNFDLFEGFFPNNLFMARRIFIIEGLITVIVAFIAYFLIAPWPEEAKFLNPREKEMMLRRLAKDRGLGKMDRLTLANFVSTLTDWKIWAGMLAYFGADHSASAIVSFQPTILRQLGYTASQAQVHTIPVFMVALVFSISIAYLSDRVAHRYAFCMFGVTLCMIGWILELAQAQPVGARYFGLFAITAGVYILMPVLVVWNMNNLGTGYKRVIGAAFQIGGGNTAALVSSNVFISKQAPKYPVGFGVGFTLNCLAGVCCTVLFFGLRAENKKRDRGVRDTRFELSEEEQENLGDQHPTFRYTL
ncbi:MAG: hypothetical protein Q9167_000936 [Letrouitia subvulpina]